MILWKPARPKIARPWVCGRCAGLRREWLREHRRHAGLSMHRVCCCSVSCLGVEALEVTLSGLDAAVCSGTCQSRRTLDSLNLDGSYIVPFDESTERFGEITCHFRAVFYGNFGSHTAFEFNGCSGDSTVGVIDEFMLAIQMENDGGTLKWSVGNFLPDGIQSGFRLYSTSTTNEWLGFNGDWSPSPNQSVGSSRTITNDCTATHDIASSGSMLVEIAT